MTRKKIQIFVSQFGFDWRAWVGDSYYISQSQYYTKWYSLQWNVSLSPSDYVCARAMWFFNVFNHVDCLNAWFTCRTLSVDLKQFNKMIHFEHGSTRTQFYCAFSSIYFWAIVVCLRCKCNQNSTNVWQKRIKSTMTERARMRASELRESREQRMVFQLFH